MVEANVRLVGDTVTVNAAAAPVPLSATVCGEPVALSVKEIAPVADPVAAGLNSTDTVQVAPAAKGLGQVVVRSMKSVDPVRAMVVKVTEELPVFFTVTDWAADVEPTVVDANVRLVGVKLSEGGADVGHAFARFATFREPSPVTRSYPTVDVYPSVEVAFSTIP